MWKKKNKDEGFALQEKHAFHCGTTKMIEKNKIHMQGLEIDPVQMNIK